MLKQSTSGVNGVRQSFFYQPLAVILSILLLPAISWLDFSNRIGGGPFQANAQLGNPCMATSNTIIRNYCDNSGIVYFTDLAQLESDAVNLYLGIHNLSARSANVIYDYGRTDLRNGIRGTMLAILIGIIQTPPASRTAHQQALFNWFQNLVHHNEVSLYQQAIGQYGSFIADPCHFTLDSDIASAESLAYDGTPFCFGGLQSSIFGVPVPAESYFTAYGLKHSYASTLTSDPNFASMVAATALSTGAVAGIALSSAAVVAGAVGAVFYASFSATLALYAVGVSSTVATSAAVGSAATSVGVLSASSIEALGVAGVVAGPVIVVFITVTIGVIAGIEVFNNQKSLDDLNALSNTLTQVTNTPPDLGAMVSDSTGQGSFKLDSTLVAQTSKDVPSTAALPAHQHVTDLSFVIAPKSTGTQQFSDTLTYRDWNGNNWSAQTWGGWFVQTCANGASTTCAQADSITGDLPYVDWFGTKWTASVLYGNRGPVFTSTKASPSSTDKACAADAITGVTAGAGSSCRSFTSTSLEMTDGSGNPVTVSMTSLAAPLITAPDLHFSLGTPSTRNFIATGNPTPSIAWVSGLGGNHFNFNLLTGSTFPLTFDGSLQATPGTYPLVLQASSSLGTVTQTFNVTIASDLNIISPNTFNVTWGVPTSFVVIATGTPTPKLSLDPTGYDLTGLTFKDNGDGTGTFGGTYSGSPFALSCIVGCGGFIATNSQGTVTQKINLSVNQAPAPIPAVTSATFRAGIANSLFLNSNGAATPVSWSYTPDPNAPWLHLTDNGNGTALLFGTPPIQTSGIFQPNIGPQAAGTVVVIPHFPVTVVNTPVFTSGNMATFTAGTQSLFGLDVNTGNISISGNLPAGLTFFSGSSLSDLFDQGSIQGAPAVGTGGQYTALLTDISTTGSAQQALILNVNEAPSITSPGLITLFAGVPASFVVSTLGFPATSTHPVSLTSPPSDPSQGNGMYFTLSGLPASLQSNNHGVSGFATGNLSVTGTPTGADVGTHRVQVTAQNAVGSPAQQTLTLQVLPFNPVTPINLLSTTLLARDASHNLVVTLVVSNGGSSAAQNVTLTSAKIGTAVGTVSPPSVPSIASSSTATFTIVFPSGSVGASGTLTSLVLSGSYTGGTFNSGGRIVLP